MTSQSLIQGNNLKNKHASATTTLSIALLRFKKNQKKKSKCSNQGACSHHGGNYKDHSKHRKQNICVFIKQ